MERFQEMSDQQWNELRSEAERFQEFFNWCGFPDNPRPPPWQQPHNPPPDGGQGGGSFTSFLQDYL